MTIFSFLIHSCPALHNAGRIKQIFAWRFAKRNRKHTRVRWTSQSRLEASNFPEEAGGLLPFSWRGIGGERGETGKRSDERSDRRLVKGLRIMVGEIEERGRDA